jgi:hypothetical protein
MRERSSKRRKEQTNRETQNHEVARQKTPKLQTITPIPYQNHAAIKSIGGLSLLPSIQCIYTGHNSYRRWTMVRKFRYQRRNKINITTQKWKLFIIVDLHHRSKRRSNRECPTLLRVFSSKFLPKTCRR